MRKIMSNEKQTSHLCKIQAERIIQFYFDLWLKSGSTGPEGMVAVHLDCPSRIRTLKMSFFGIQVPKSSMEGKTRYQELLSKNSFSNSTKWQRMFYPQVYSSLPTGTM